MSEHSVNVEKAKARTKERKARLPALAKAELAQDKDQAKRGRLAVASTEGSPVIFRKIAGCRRAHPKATDSAMAKARMRRQRQERGWCRREY